jgi:hypothetical protein
MVKGSHPYVSCFNYACFCVVVGGLYSCFFFKRRSDHVPIINQKKKKRQVGLLLFCFHIIANTKKKRGEINNAGRT